MLYITCLGVGKTRIELKRDHVVLTDEVEGFFEKVVTKFGGGAKIDCPVRFLGRKVYVVVCKE
jgi:putative transposon-encoded protein